MSVAAKLAAFAAVLVLCFGAAYGVGAAVGPIDQDDPATSHSTSTPHGSPSTTAADQDGAHGSDHGG